MLSGAAPCISPTSSLILDAIEADLRTRVVDADWLHERTRGLSMTLEQAVAYALEEQPSA